MKRIFLFSIILIVLIAGRAFSQQKGTVEVFKDPQIDSLIARRAALSRRANASMPQGFRIQIFSGTDRKEAYAEQTKFRKLFPGTASYISYAQPNYKVRVGDFRTRLEADKMMNRLKRNYPVLFIFSERINTR